MSATFADENDFPSWETPRISNGSHLSITAFARFEFEAGKGNEGTKVLMVEWEDDDLTRSSAGSWHVSWEGKTTVLPTDEQPNENTRRFYFLLPPAVTIPPVVTLLHMQHPTSASTIRQPVSIQINPLPAIFPAELGATARTAGKKGVLHTIWAKKRLQALEKEIQEECINNVEGIALQMAIQEKEWIEANYGVSVPSSANIGSPSPAASTASFPPTTPISPTAGRNLGEKLRGLKLETSEKDWAKRTEGHVNFRDSENGAHLLSPESPDVAVSSFNSFRNIPLSGTEWTRVVSHGPPQSLQEKQNMESDLAFNNALTRSESADSTDDLFAKALSPRTPDLPRSPFSFAPFETAVPMVVKRA